MKTRATPYIVGFALILFAVPTLACDTVDAYVQAGTTGSRSGLSFFQIIVSEELAGPATQGIPVRNRPALTPDF
jgi:hypothetical protein